MKKNGGTRSLAISRSRNVNEEFTKYYKNVHVPPAAGDEGQALGTYMHADFMLNNNVHIPNVYAGKKHSVNKKIFDGFVIIIFQKFRAFSKISNSFFPYF